MLNEPYIIDDEFKYWWKTRHVDYLGRWMVRNCIKHRRKGLNNPHLVFESEEEYQKLLKRQIRMAKKENK
jgi:hypothetical protein